MNSTFLNEEALIRNVPSIFATSGSENTSSRYGFIPTIEVVRGLRTNGFYPVAAMQSKSRIEGRQQFVKHVMRFRHESNVDLQKKDGLFSEIVLINSHDGSTSYQLKAGVFRLVCSNGLIVGDECFSRKVKHQGDVINNVVKAANDLIEIAPISVKKAIEWQGVELKPEQSKVFAEVASTLKWEVDQVPLTPTQILKPRRFDDNKNDLWTTFNVIQENLIRGGVRYHTEEGDRMKTRPVNSISENVRLNTALWTLTEKMAELAR